MADEQEHGNDQDHHSAIKTFENVELAFFKQFGYLCLCKPTIQYEDQIFPFPF